MLSMRVGQGWDIHQLVSGRPLILGGVAIPHSMGLEGHSDADVLLHAVIDALLGAASLGDIGSMFSDTDPCYKGANSRELLRCAWSEVQKAGWRLVNLDSTIIAELPKLAPYIPSMRDAISADLSVGKSQISVKAKTSEKLGVVGELKAIEALCVVLLVCE